MNKKIYSLKVSFILTLLLVFNLTVEAQTPEKLSYQAVIRDASQNLVVDAPIGMRVSILQDTENGTVVYSEELSPTTNSNGLVSIYIGEGGGLANIDWSHANYFIKIETDIAGGSNYTIQTTSQLLSVPYAFHAKTAQEFTPGNSVGEMKYWNGSEWASIAAGNEGDVLTFVNNTPTWIGEPGDVDEVPHVVSPATGRIWMDRNLGATQVATSMSDAAAFGDLYQWGRGTDGHEKRSAGATPSLSSSDTPNHTDFIMNPNSPFDWRVPQNHTLWNGTDGINNPCPNGYRLPTENEWNLERVHWSSNDAEGAFNSFLKLPSAGQRKFSDGSFVSEGLSGSYWSSTLSNEGGGIYSRFLNFRYSAYVISSHRATAMSVRCIKD